MKSRSIIATTSLATLLFLGLFGRARGDDASKPPHLIAAEDIAAQIAPEDNDYVYKAIYVHWKGVDGATKYENHSDCSGFFDLLMEHSYGIKTKQLKKWTGHNRPTAAVWFDAVSSGSAQSILTPIPTIDQARPGDVILIKYQPGEQTDTGHVMIIDSTPQTRDSTAPEIADTTQWELRVIDSSKSGHGPHDTRHQPDGTFSRGVGMGIFRFYTHADNTIAGYSWSALKASKFEPISEHQVMLARITPPAQEQATTEP
jgi:hypothetical protein